MSNKISCARKMAGVALAATIGLSQPAMAGGIPVIDVSSLTQQILQVQHMLTQIEQLKSQLETANKELDSMSGVRGLGNVIDSAYDTAVNVDPNQVLSDAGIRGASEHGLSGDVADLYDSGNQNTAIWLGCMVPECSGLWYDSLTEEDPWLRYFTNAPRPRTLSEQKYSDRRLRSQS